MRDGRGPRRLLRPPSADRIHDAVANRIPLVHEARGPFPILLNGRRQRERNRHFKGIEVEFVPLPSTSPRPLHWNTEESRSGALEEWCTALRTCGIGVSIAT